MYWTEADPETGKTIFVEKDLRKKQRQKEIITRPKRIDKFPLGFS